VSGTPNAVMLPPLVKAEDGCTRADIPIPMQRMANTVDRASNRNFVTDRGMDLDIRLSSHCAGLTGRSFVVSNSAGGNTV
jgi:hypothetical protein